MRPEHMTSYVLINSCLEVKNAHGLEMLNIKTNANDNHDPTPILEPALLANKIRDWEHVRRLSKESQKVHSNLTMKANYLGICNFLIRQLDWITYRACLKETGSSSDRALPDLT